jgi:hypothetical protein
MGVGRSIRSTPIGRRGVTFLFPEHTRLHGRFEQMVINQPRGNFALLSALGLAGPYSQYFQAIVRGTRNLYLGLLRESVTSR